MKHISPSLIFFNYYYRFQYFALDTSGLSWYQKSLRFSRRASMITLDSRQDQNVISSLQSRPQGFKSFCPLSEILFFLDQQHCRSQSCENYSPCWNLLVLNKRVVWYLLTAPCNFLFISYFIRVFHWSLNLIWLISTAPDCCLLCMSSYSLRHPLIWIIIHIRQSTLHHWLYLYQWSTRTNTIWVLESASNQ